MPAVILFYNAVVKNWDVIIVGGGIIGLSLSIALRKRGAKVLVVERGEPGQEASHAAAGMLVECGAETPTLLQPLAIASARMYPEFAHELQDESGIDVDLREQGTLLFPPPEHVHDRPGFTTESLLPAALAQLEPALAGLKCAVTFLKECSVDPRALVSAALKAAKHRDADISSGTNVTELLLSDGRVAGIRTDKTTYAASVVVNCAGAWAGQLPPHSFPTRPVKGQMLAVVSAKPMLQHVIRAPEVYLVPRSDGRILIGATVEEAGYDKRTDADTIQRLHQAAIDLVPALKPARVLEAWAGLRPGTPDDLPILGATATPGYFVATGHFRNGILLAPVTAHVMAQVMTGVKSEYDISAFSPGRFES
ncbi:MAG TPA: glycine oxidase ThiO [Terriglobales bacterium]|nr:glycine oxidase ThiO [Terriglobales bacterium]